eukprot:scaffold12814_cov54-Attheya_sp.AAC.1
MEIEAATHKRDLSFGFTFDQKRMKKDCRRHILLYGEKAMFIRNKKFHDRQLIGIAYRNNGSVTLGTSTKYSDMHWDLVCKTPHDRKNSQSVEWRKTSWMNPIGTLTDADKSLLDISLETEPVTTVGANAGWFLL